MKFVIKNGILESCIVKNETEVVIPDGVTTIGSYSFVGQNCTSIIIPNGVTKINSFAFSDCRNLTSVIIPNSVTYIGSYAFEYCVNLISIVIPDGVQTIDGRAFLGCKNLTNIVIPNSITYIGFGAFDGCTNLQTATKSYKAFELINNELMCRDYQFKVNEWSEEEEDICMCWRGYHYCTNLFEVFNYYGGKLDKVITIYECEVGNEVKTDIYNSDSSKCVTNKIKPAKRLYKDDIIKILNNAESR